MQTKSDKTKPRYKFSTDALFLCKFSTEHVVDKRLGCLKIVHAHTGLQVDTGVYHKSSP